MGSKDNQGGTAFPIGQVLRDTYGDNDTKHVTRVGTNKRTIRIIGIESDGRYLAETLTDMHGTALDHPRKTRVSEKTLRAGYVPMVEGK